MFSQDTILRLTNEAIYLRTLVLDNILFDQKLLKKYISLAILAVKFDIHTGIFSKPFVALHYKIYCTILYVLPYPSHKAMYNSFHKICVKCFTKLNLGNGIASERPGITVLDFYLQGFSL